MVDYFGCGHVIKQKDVVRFSVTKLYDIENKIIPADARRAAEDSVPGVRYTVSPPFDSPPPGYTARGIGGRTVGAPLMV